jgi:peptidoglycan-associated lipoprotein
MKGMFRGRFQLGLLALGVLAMTVGVGATGCSSKKKGGVYDSSIGGQGGAYGGDSSLAQFEQSGTVLGASGDFRDVPFAFDSDQLDSASMDAVRANSSVLQSHPDRRVEIEGHCDERGTSEYNLALGARRARAVKDAMVGMGVAADRMSTVSYGEELPLCKESTESCWATNRRAHFTDLNR